MIGSDLAGSRSYRSYVRRAETPLCAPHLHQSAASTSASAATHPSESMYQYQGATEVYDCPERLAKLIHAEDDRDADPHEHAPQHGTGKRQAPLLAEGVNHKRCRVASVMDDHHCIPLCEPRRVTA